MREGARSDETAAQLQGQFFRDVAEGLELFHILAHALEVTAKTNRTSAPEKRQRSVCNIIKMSSFFTVRRTLRLKSKHSMVKRLKCLL